MINSIKFLLDGIKQYSISFYDKLFINLSMWSLATFRKHPQWIFFSQSDLYSLASAVEIPLPTGGVCLSSCVSYTKYATKNENAVAILNGKIKDKNASFIEKTLLYQIQSSLISYRLDEKKLFDNICSIESLFPEYANTAKCIGLQMWDGDLGHALVIKRNTNDKGETTYNLFDPCFGEVQNLNTYALKRWLKILKATYSYGKGINFTEFTSYDIENESAHVTNLCSQKNNRGIKHLKLSGVLSDENGNNIIKYLVENLAVDLNKKDYKGYTPLDHAIKLRDQHMVNILINNGATAGL